MVLSRSQHHAAAITAVAPLTLFGGTVVAAAAQFPTATLVQPVADPDDPT
jgi:hypothetical protein